MKIQWLWIAKLEFPLNQCLEILYTTVSSMIFVNNYIQSVTWKFCSSSSYNATQSIL